MDTPTSRTAHLVGPPPASPARGRARRIATALLGWAVVGGLACSSSSPSPAGSHDAGEAKGDAADGSTGTRDAATADGLAPVLDGGAIGVTWPPAVLAYLHAMSVLQPPGGSVDLNGDGVDDLTVAFDGTGTQTVTVLSSTHAISTFHTHTDGTVDGTRDMNDDGTTDYTYAFTGSGDDWTETTLRDTRMSGTYDERRTRVFSSYTALVPTFTQTLETLDYSVTPPAFQTVATYAGSTIEGARCAPPLPSPPPSPLFVPGEGCLEGANAEDIPPNAWDGAVEVALSPVNGSSGRVPFVRILVDGPSGCDAAQTSALATILPAVIGDMNTALGILNPGLQGELFRGLGMGRWLLTCGRTCDGAGTVTVAQGRPSAAFYPTSFNPNVLLEDPLTVQEVLAHEMLHFIGEPHTPDPATGDGGRDLVYSCSRQSVPGCRVGPPDADGNGQAWPSDPPWAFTSTFNGPPSNAYWYNSRRDCAACASDDHKQDCSDPSDPSFPGTEFYVETTDPLNQIWNATSALSIPFEVCQGPSTPICAIDDQWSYCDGTPVPLKQQANLHDMNQAVCSLSCPGPSPQPDDDCATYVGDFDSEILCNGAMVQIAKITREWSCGESLCKGPAKPMNCPY